ncbi:MAG TPA: N-acetylneuraminate synthase family protein [Phycisphaerales bacterium]|nr:N-acetylneuraminate synthase family protein [Phycisphaerales bacterium]
MKIRDRDVRAHIEGGGEPYIIAEIGVNHDGSVEKCLALIDAAAETGADAIKLQYFRAEMLMSRSAALADYQRKAGERDPIEMLKRLEIRGQDLPPLVKHAHARGLHAIVTVFSEPLVVETERAAFDAYKSASPDIINRPLLDAMAKTGKPLIVSTGAATIDEIARAASWFAPCYDIAFLQCVSAYPAPDETASLGAIAFLAERLKRPIGYSDHTTRVETGAIAVAAGACILEKHLTLDRDAPGPDHAASLDPRQFGEYARLARLAHRMMGSREKTVLDVEQDVRTASRQSIVAAKPVRAGSPITADMLAVKRPGGGVEPWRMDGLLGRRASRDIAADATIHEGDFS